MGTGTGTRPWVQVRHVTKSWVRVRLQVDIDIDMGMGMGMGTGPWVQVRVWVRVQDVKLLIKDCGYN